MALLPSRDKRCGAEIDTAKFLLLELGAARSGSQTTPMTRLTDKVGGWLICSNIVRNHDD